jgi:hypothetical protein
MTNATASRAPKKCMQEAPIFSSLPGLILQNVPFAVVIPLRMTPSVAFAVVIDGTNKPMRIIILPLHLS